MFPLGCRSEEAAAALFGFLDVSALTAARAACQGQNAAISVIGHRHHRAQNKHMGTVWPCTNAMLDFVYNTDFESLGQRFSCRHPTVLVDSCRFWPESTGACRPNCNMTHCTATAVAHKLYQVVCFADANPGD